MSNSFTSCFEKFNMLDNDLQNLILSKIIFSQNKNLLNDIIMYKKQKDKIYELYTNLGFYDSPNEMDDLNIHAWIENDLIAYYNDNCPYFDNNNNINIIENNKKKLFRQLVFKIKSKNDNNLYRKYFIDNNHILCKTKVNRLLANLLYKEREEFIKIFDI